jgi:hypothetical protein
VRSRRTQPFHTEDGGGMSFRNVGSYMSHTASYPRRRHSASLNAKARHTATGWSGMHGRLSRVRAGALQKDRQLWILKVAVLGPEELWPAPYIHTYTDTSLSVALFVVSLPAVRRKDQGPQLHCNCLT